MKEPIRPDGITDEEWEVLRASHITAQEKAALRPEPVVQVKESIETAMSRLEKLPALVVPPSRSVSDKYLELLAKAGIPDRHWKAFTDKPLADCKVWNEKLLKVQSYLGKGCMLGIIGDRGRGKTQLAVNAVISVCKAQRHARFCTAMDFFMDIKSSFKEKSKLDEQDVIKSYLKPSLWVIDEIHERSESEWENRLLFHTINKRYENGTDTIMIGAYHDANPKVAKESFKKAVGPSIASRIRETGGIVQALWPSFRGD